MRLQTSSAGLAIGDADNRYLRLAGGTMTGELNALAGLNTVRPYSSGLVPAGLSDPAPAFPFETQWNNAGKNWTAVRVSVTNTASGSASKIADFQVGGNSLVSFPKGGGFTLHQAGDFSAAFPFSAIDGGYALGVGLAYNPAVAIRDGADYGLIGQNIRATEGGLIGWGPSATVATMSATDTALRRNAAGVIEFNNGTAGTLRDWKARRGSLSEYLDITEMSAPAAPAANTARLYVEDNGSGKTRLMVLFPTGAAQVLATEP